MSQLHYPHNDTYHDIQDCYCVVVNTFLASLSCFCNSLCCSCILLFHSCSCSSWILCFSSSFSLILSSILFIFSVSNFSSRSFTWARSDSSSCKQSAEIVRETRRNGREMLCSVFCCAIVKWFRCFFNYWHCGLLENKSPTTHFFHLICTHSTYMIHR